MGLNSEKRCFTKKCKEKYCLKCLYHLNEFCRLAEFGEESKFNHIQEDDTVPGEILPALAKSNASRFSLLGSSLCTNKKVTSEAMI